MAPIINMNEIDIYPVGLLSDLAAFVHDHDRKRAKSNLWFHMKYPLGQARMRNWRAVRNYFNGYLAEPNSHYEGFFRCGHGWTRGRAYRDLIRSMEE